MPNRIARQLLPHSVDALKFCQQRAEVSGLLPVSMLPRLSGQLQLPEGEIAVELQFGVDDQSRKTMQGHLQAILPLQCQRCLERLDVAVSADLSLALVWTDEQAAQLPRTLDPVLMESQELDLHKIIEDEVLLALPLVANHEPGSCEPPRSSAGQLADDEPVRTANPFQVLAALKSGDKSEQ